MQTTSYYIDSCIYLNLWQKEEGKIFGKPFWFLARKLFEKLEARNSIIYYSGFLLKEMSFILTQEEFNKKRIMFETSPNFKKIEITTTELNLARKIESQTNFDISFYDIIHMILAKKTNSILVTRDKKLLRLARKQEVISKKPEEIL